MQSKYWKRCVVVGTLTCAASYLLVKTTTPALTASEAAFCQREKIAPRDMKLVTDLEDRPLSYPTGRQTFDYLTVTDGEWKRLVQLSETNNLLRVRAVGAVCFCQKQNSAARREEALRLAHRLLRKDNDFDPWNGLKIMEAYQAPEWRAEMERQRDSKYQIIRDYVKMKTAEATGA